MSLECVGFEDAKILSVEDSCEDGDLCVFSFCEDGELMEIVVVPEEEDETY
uniref:Uncharacterized protein n=1 Tax=Medicago truncatula TaxID=3880 RepID=A2Q4W1_MEDTR|nr:hypothetical protein MtrDRAFT_AC157891g34v2 [Medicago truncatula]